MKLTVSQVKLKKYRKPSKIKGLQYFFILRETICFNRGDRIRTCKFIAYKPHKYGILENP